MLFVHASPVTHYCKVKASLPLAPIDSLIFVDSFEINEANQPNSCSYVDGVIRK